MVNALVETLLSWRCFNRLRIPPDNFEFWHDSFLQYRPDGIKHLDSNVYSKGNGNAITRFPHSPIPQTINVKENAVRGAFTVADLLLTANIRK
jgi:hypothetical protein